MSQTDRLEAMMSRQEIHDVVMRHSRGVDRADEDLLKSCYHSDAIEEHGTAFTGPAYEYIEGAVGRIRKMGTMVHYNCNVHIDLVDGPRSDLAYVETYILTFVRFKDGEQDVDTFTGGRACDRFERRDGEWRIAHRKLVFDWNRDTPSQEGWCLGMFDRSNPAMHLGQKSKQDLSYQRF